MSNVQDWQSVGSGKYSHWMGLIETINNITVYFWKWKTKWNKDDK